MNHETTTYVDPATQIPAPHHTRAIKYGVLNSLSLASDSKLLNTKSANMPSLIIFSRVPSLMAKFNSFISVLEFLYTGDYSFVEAYLSQKRNNKYFDK